MQVRVQKFLSQSGYCSRRKAENLILEGMVTVNDNMAVIGQVIDPSKDTVKVEGERIKNLEKKRIVLMLNKPRGVVCSHENKNFTEKTVFDFIPKEFSNERFLFCGRLDKESQGMLMLTNDGEFANKLTHPSSNIIKTYQVTLAKPIFPENMQKMLDGIWDDNETLRAEKVTEIPKSLNRQVLEIQLKQGRKREIRRMIESFGSHVHRLKRVQIGQLKMKTLGVGYVKYLTEGDIALLFK